MTDLNKFTATGRITANAELKYTQSGTACTTFSIAVNKSYKKDDTWEERVHFFNNLPEWVTLDTACKLKGGGALETYRAKLFLQPCCGTNAQYVCGRKSWHKQDVIEWLSVTDHSLKAYAEKYGVTIPANYAERSKQ